MCGVAGILSFGGAMPTRAKLATMSLALAHRGPDGAGVEVIGRCGLAHRRLSIIDLSALGKQPMSTADGKLWLTFNGEIYNYLELREELEKKGVQFRSHTDSEVILYAYRTWGLDAFSRFNGMWGLGIWDSVEQQLILSRDRMGVKPLYFHKDEQRLLFASEVKAMLAGEPELAQIDVSSIAEFIDRPLIGYGKETFFRGVERVDPGAILIADARGNVKNRRYWHFLPPSEPRDISDERAAEEVRELLADSVRLRFRSDVPVGTCLSGGLDSSSIVALAGKRLGKTPESFSAVYDIPEFAEREFIEIMIRDLKLTGHQVSPDASDLPEVMERANYHQEEPTAGPGIYSQWHVMRIASPRVKVLLDGQGGDELFAGYFPYFDTYIQALIERAKKFDRAAISELLAAGPEIAELTGRDPVRDKAERFAKAKLRGLRGTAIRTLRPLVERQPQLHGLMKELRRRTEGTPSPASPKTLSLLREHLRPANDNRHVVPAVSGDIFTDLLWDQLTRTSIPGLLHYEDRNSMAFSIEARVPFLDYRLIELAFQLPMRVKMNKGRTKVVLRDAMKGILPEAIRERKDKKGYPTPFALWLKQANHLDWARDLLFSKRTRERGFIDTAQSEALWNQHLSGVDHSWRLWQLVTLELFCRRFGDQPFVPEAPPPHAVREELNDQADRPRDQLGA